MKSMLLLPLLLCSLAVMAQVRVQNPRMENLINPIGLDVTQPRFGWQLAADRRNVLQTAYEIRVASSSVGSLKRQKTALDFRQNPVRRFRLGTVQWPGPAIGQKILVAGAGLGQCGKSLQLERTSLLANGIADCLRLESKMDFARCAGRFFPALPHVSQGICGKEKNRFSHRFYHCTWDV